MRKLKVDDAAAEAQVSATYIRKKIHEGAFETEVIGKAIHIIVGDEPLVLRPMQTKKCPCGRSFKTRNPKKEFHSSKCYVKWYYNMWLGKTRRDPQRNIKIKRLRESGLSYGQIAKQVGVTRARVHQIIRDSKKRKK